MICGDINQGGKIASQNNYTGLNHPALKVQGFCARTESPL